jgi:hypothetical protein
MNHEMSGVAERLANEFTHLPWRASPMFLEQAARAVLAKPLTA